MGGGAEPGPGVDACEPLAGDDISKHVLGGRGRLSTPPQPLFADEAQAFPADLFAQAKPIDRRRHGSGRSTRVVATSSYCVTRASGASFRILAAKAAVLASALPGM